MSYQTIRMSGCSSLSMDALVSSLKRELPGELVSETRKYFDDGEAALLILEKYFFRNGSYANLTVFLTERAGAWTADIVGSGGGEGIFNFSLGANADFARAAEKVLEGYGFAA